MRKILLLSVLLVFCLPFTAFASLISQTGSVFTDTLYYDSSIDEYHIDLDPNLLAGGSVVHETYTNSSYSGTPYFHGVAYFPWNMTYAYALYNCKLYNVDRFYSSGGTLIGEVKFYPDQVINNQCSSSYSPATQSTPFSNPSGSDDDSAVIGAMNQLDSDILNLSSKMDGLNSSLADMNGTLNQILSTDQSILSGVNSIVAQLQTSQSLDSGSVPSAPDITTGNLDSAKPSEQPSFQDNSSYFSDQGNSSDGSPDIPSIPGIADCWQSTCKQPDPTPDNPLNPDTQLTVDNQFSADNPLIKDSELSKDVVPVADSFTQDSQMSQDTFSQDPGLSKDSELSKDQFTQDPNLNTDSFTQDPEHSQTNSFSQTNSYTQDPELTVTN